MLYFVTELDKRPDGVVNNSITARQTLASGLSLYYQRASVAVMTDAYTGVALTLQDEEGTILLNERFNTSHVEPTEEQTEEQTDG